MSTPTLIRGSRVETLTEAQADREVRAIGPRRALSEAQQRRFDEALVLVEAAFHGNKRKMLDLQEALTTSDFQYLFGSILDRQLMETYQQLPSFWPQYATKCLVNDFRPKRWIDLLGGRGALSLVPERDEYPAVAMTDNKYDLRVAKYGNRVGLSWEDFVNDDLDALRTAPQRLAQAARDTEEKVAAGSLATSTGPSPAFFNTANGNLMGANAQFSTTVNPVLSADSLKAALTVMGQRKDSDGRPIVVPVAVLMVPPGLETIANDIVNATEIRTTTAGGSTVITGNWLANKVRVVVNPWLNVVDTSATSATTWYLLPAAETPRPALAVGFLRGHDVPDLRVSSNTGNSLGGGALGPEDGSFENDDVQYRVRHVVGASTLDPLATMVSTGKGS